MGFSLAELEIAKKILTYALAYAIMKAQIEGGNVYVFYL
jgi:hypothetical protein